MPDTKKVISLDDALGMFGVMEAAEVPGIDEQSPLFGWHAVVQQHGFEDVVIAYFVSEQGALRFRIAEINRVLNG